MGAGTTRAADANYLFAEMRADALSGQLPLPELSDAEFGEPPADQRPCCPECLHRKSPK